MGPLKVVIKDFSDDQLFTVFPLTRCDIILGKPWLTRNNPTINYKTNEVQLHCEPFIADSYTVRQGGEDHSQLESFLIPGRSASRALRHGATGFLAYITDEAATTRTTNRPPDLQKLLDHQKEIFPDELPCQLPPTRSVDHEIKVEAEWKPPSRPAYRLSKPKIDELQKQITEMLKRCFIEASKSLYGAPVFFCKKKRW